jgi:hypothetical protein
MRDSFKVLFSSPEKTIIPDPPYVNKLSVATPIGDPGLAPACWPRSSSAADINGVGRPRIRPGVLLQVGYGPCVGQQGLTYG